MSKNRNRIFALLSSLFILSGCQNPMIPSGYVPGIKEVSSGVYGAWIKVKAFSDSIENLSLELSGELIAVSNDSLYVLTEVDLIALHRDRISGASLYLFRSRNLPMFGFLGLIPTFIGIVASADYGAGFFVLGLPLLTTTVLQAVLKGNSVLLYPEKATMDDLVKYARYPQGLPPGINREILHLKI